MRQVILRADDISATTEVAELFRIYGPCWDRGYPVCFSVIPRSASRFPECGPELVSPTDLRENANLCAFLVELGNVGLVEIALHGWEHRYGELAGNSESAICPRIAAGLEVLREALPGIPVRVLVPPHDHISPAGLRAARRHHLVLCSTWAACHGGTRLAHHWARIRRMMGMPTARSMRGDWCTDVAVLDFQGLESKDRSRTRQLLDRSARQHSPAVLTQHFWRLLDVTGEPNALHERWLRWLAWISDTDDVEFVRYGDSRNP